MEDYRKSNIFLQKFLSFVLAKYGGMKRLVVTIDNMSIQKRHIFEISRPSFSSEHVKWPGKINFPKLFLKKKIGKKIMGQSILLDRNLKFWGEEIES